MYLSELMPMLSVSAHHLNPEIKIFKKTVPTLVVCPNLGWDEFLSGINLIPKEKMKITPSQIWANDQGRDSFFEDFDLRMEMVG